MPREFDRTTARMPATIRPTRSGSPVESRDHPRRVAAICPRAASAAGSSRQRLPSASAACKRTRLAGSSASVASRAVEIHGADAFGSIAAATRRACSRSAGLGSPMTSFTTAGVTAFRAASVQRACSRARGCVWSCKKIHQHRHGRTILAFSRATAVRSHATRRSDDGESRQVGPCRHWLIRGFRPSAIAPEPGRTRQIRPRSCQRRNSTDPRTDSGTNCGCSTSSRYMSTM